MAPDDSLPVKRIGIVCAGSMGSMMALGISELGVDVSLWDISSEHVMNALSTRSESGADKYGNIGGFTEISEFVDILHTEQVKVLIAGSLEGWGVHGQIDSEVQS